MGRMTTHPKNQPTTYDGEFLVGNPPAVKPGKDLNKDDKDELQKLFEPEKTAADAKHEQLKKDGRLGMLLPPLDRDPRYREEYASRENGTPNETGDYLPPVAGPQSEVTGTVLAAGGESGPRDYVLATITESGTKHFWRGLTDTNGHFNFKIPEGIASVLLFRHFDRNGEPDSGARCEVSSEHVPNTLPLADQMIKGSPTIVDGDSSYEPAGDSHGIVHLGTRGTDPLHTRVLLDGSDRKIQTLGASNESVVAQMSPDTPLGRHKLALESDGEPSTAFPFDAVSLHADPLPPAESGAVETLTVHVAGIPASDSAVMYFQIGGAAQAAGPTEIPVRNGVAQMKLRGIRAGQALIHYRLHVIIANFWARR